MRVLIKHWRKRRHMTQQDLAARIGISQPTLSRVENGQLPITLTLLNRCAIALETHVEELYSVSSPNGQEHAHG